MSSDAEYAAEPIAEETLAARVEELLAALTLQEKLGLCSGRGLWQSASIKRLGLRALSMTDGPHGIAFHSSLKRATRFPAEIALAASWNPALLQEYGVALGVEAKTVAKQVVLGPGVNICRTPLNGRTFEYFTEDPWLNSRLAVALILGIQSEGVAACIKHFAANNQETRRMSVDVNVSERALREIYLPAFEAAVKEAEVQTVMACYNKVNGDQGCENHRLLNQVLREEWGFKGLVLSDWFAARNTRDTASSVRGGLDLEMPGLAAKRMRAKDLKRSLQAGEIEEQHLDSKVRALLRTMLLTGCDKSITKARKIDAQAHRPLALRLARESMVLLKNEGNSLPIDVDAVTRIAVVGEHAGRRFTGPLKGGSSGVWPRREITPLLALQDYSRGRFELTEDVAGADVVILFAGLGHKIHQDCEHYDRQQLQLPDEQVALIHSTVALNSNTVVVLINGSPLAMEPWLESVPAVLEAWYGGQEAGTAIVELLFGEANPCGKLPVTFPRNLAQSPAHVSERTFPGDAQVHYDEGIMVGYRHFDHEQLEPLFPFGHGLSYSQFDYSACLLNEEKLSADGSIELRVTVTNASERAGAEVLQFYISELSPRLVRPPKELKHFARVDLAAGASEEVCCTINRSMLCYYDEVENRWRADAGDYCVHVGSSSRDLRGEAHFQLLA